MTNLIDTIDFDAAEAYLSIEIARKNGSVVLEIDDDCDE